MRPRVYTVVDQMPVKTAVAPQPQEPAGYVQGIKHVQFRVTKQQDRQLKLEAKALGITRNEAARRRCFPEER
jgi:hypothetical protein